MIFDLDPQSTKYSSDKILEMTEYFTDAVDMGMLYLNYPMIESFFHSVISALKNCGAPTQLAVFTIQLDTGSY